MWTLNDLRQNFNDWSRQTRNRKAGSGEFLESYISFMYDSLINRHAKNISVRRNAKIKDTRGNSYDIDVYFEFDIANIKHRVAVECKDHKRPVTRDQVIAFCGKLNEMPSTIGVFVSLSGFQSGAAKYLEDHGIHHISENELPSFGKLVVDKYISPLLPDATAVGEPFWTIMEARDGNTTGSWMLAPWSAELREQIPEGEGRTIPLFWLHGDAEKYGNDVFKERESWCVRGLEQATLRVFIGLARLQGMTFMTFRGRQHDGHTLFEIERFSPDDLQEIALR